jgi:mono/diheme cytochrome c family protein
MYKHYCASCHGTDAKGHGPTAAALKARPADLTGLSRENGGKYPSLLVKAAIRGDSSVLAHGSKEMPVWGSLFWHVSVGDQQEVSLRINNLTRYVQSLQRD